MRSYRTMTYRSLGAWCAALAAGVLVGGCAAEATEEAEAGEVESELGGLLIKPDDSTLPRGYAAMSADDKRAALALGIKSSKYAELPKLKNTVWSKGALALNLVVNEGFLRPSISAETDLTAPRREKIIHKWGVAGLVSFEPDADAHLTGLLSKPTHALIRLSAASDPAEGFIPALALKFFVDGRPSVNLILGSETTGLDGQRANWNFFAGGMSNRVSAPTNPQAKFLIKVASKVSSDPLRTDLESLFKHKVDGKLESRPQNPDELVLEPTAAIAKRTPADSRDDFRMTLASIPVATPLYDVYVRDTKGAPKRHVARLTTSTPLVASHLGDRIFFKHDVN